jgi:hypothetical protein
MRHALLIAVVLAGCHHKQASTDDGEEHTAPVGKGDGPVYTDDKNQIPPEKMDEVQRLLGRREEAVSRCLAMVIDNKDLPRNSHGKVTVSLTVTTDGKASDVKIDSSTIDSKPLHDCVLKKVGETAFPQVSRPFQTSYTYAFEAS